MAVQQVAYFECFAGIHDFVDYIRHHHCIEQTIRNSWTNSFGHLNKLAQVDFYFRRVDPASGCRATATGATASPDHPDSP